jgi:hypothetical protein
MDGLIYTINKLGLALAQAEADLQQRDVLIADLTGRLDQVTADSDSHQG